MKDIVRIMAFLFIAAARLNNAGKFAELEQLKVFHVEQYWMRIARQGTAINVGALVRHTPVRLYVMGKEVTERPASEAEIGQMREIVRGAIKAGAPRFAMSKAPRHMGYEGKPVPSRAASVAEIKSLAAAGR